MVSLPQHLNTLTPEYGVKVGFGRWGDVKNNCGGSASGQISQYKMISNVGSSIFSLCSGCDRLTRAAEAAHRFTGLCGFTQLNGTRFEQCASGLSEPVNLCLPK